MEPTRTNLQYPSSIPGKIVALYAIFSALWIFFSDSLLAFMVKDPHLMSQIAILKGWFFILVTSILLLFLIRRYVASLKDINEKLELQQQQLLLSQFTIDMSADMIYWVDKDARFFYVNQSACQRLGYSPEELRAMTVADIDINFQKDVWPQHWDELRAKQRLSFESIHRSKTGECYPVELSANFIVYGGKEFNCSYVRDITSRKQFEQTLLESERRFRELMEQVHMIAVMLDDQGKIIFCNDFLLQLTGWTREEVMGTNWFDTFIPEDLRDTIRSVFHQGLSTGEICPHHENGILTRSGVECLIVWDNTLLRDSEGAVIGVACLGIDVSAHRDLEAQLRQSQKMESIGTLAGGVAHDFNNILTVIMSCSEMLRSKLDNRERAFTLTDQIYSSAQRAAKLTRSLLAFSRKQQIITQELNLNELINQLHDFLERIIGEDVELKIDLCEKPLIVMADRGQIEQVIMNIVSNARDAMPHGGSLIISTSMARLDGRTFEDGLAISGLYALLTLSDTGVGISSHEQERIFEPFFTTKDVGKGTGLGLSMAYGIIRQHKGWISVDSKVGGGSCFSVYLPQVVRSEHVEKAAVESSHHGVETILLVEDDEQVLLATVAMLEDSGYQVLLARNGAEAVKIFKEKHAGIDLVITDVIMPQMNGRQVYEELKKQDPHLRVLFTSGYTFDVLDRTGLSEDCPLVSKPLMPQEFLGMVRSLLDQSKQ